jgi:acetyl esterase/lipase
VCAGSHVVLQIDLRLNPIDKPRSANFPKTDPFSFLMPLHNCYAERSLGRGGSDDMNPRLHPTLSPLGTLPRNLLLLVAGIDVLVQENADFVARVEGEIQEAEDEGQLQKGWRQIESVTYPKGFHGWLEVPISIVDKKEREEAFGKAAEVVKRANKQCGFKFGQSS